MNSPAVIYAVRWLVRDTFRQARASGLLAVMLAATAVCTLVCLSAGVRGADSPFRPGETQELLPPGDPQARDPARLARHGVDAPRGEFSLAFGSFRVPLRRYKEDAVHYFQLLLAGGVADTLGILLALVWTAGFLPGFLDPRSAAVLLAKPVPRWVLLLGKYLGVVAFVAVQAALFVGGTWVALGVRTGVWDATYLWCAPVLVFHFAAVFSFSALLAVYTRSTAACVLGSVLFWLVCWGANYAYLTLATLPASQALPPPLGGFLEAGYWVLPKPVDLNLLLFDLLRARNYFGRLFDLERLQESGALQAELSLATSLLFTGLALVLGARRLARTDF